MTYFGHTSLLYRNPNDVSQDMFNKFYLNIDKLCNYAFNVGNYERHWNMFAMGDLRRAFLH